MILTLVTYFFVQNSKTSQSVESFMLCETTIEDLPFIGFVLWTFTNVFRFDRIAKVQSHLYSTKLKMYLDEQILFQIFIILHHGYFILR